MGLILDTSVLIEAERKTIDFSLWQNYGDAYISAITVTELLVGVHRANTEERRVKRSVFVEHIIGSLTSLPFQEAEARVYAQLLGTLWNQGFNVGAHDMIIAATALSYNYAILTYNTSDFIKIPGLDVLSPSS